MKKKILTGFGLLLVFFVVGSIVAATYITRTTRNMDRLIMLHQVEILREDLIIHVQQVQSHIYRNKMRTGGDADVLIAQVREMDRVMESCVGCHHSPELAQGLLGMRDMANDYKASISRLLTASANPQRISMLERRAQDLGQELITMTQGMAFTANVRLQQQTRETMTTMREVRDVLYVTLFASVILAVVTAYVLARGLDNQLRKLLDATRRIANGELRHRVDINDTEGAEFKELGESFNMMTHNLHVSQRQLIQSAKLAAIGELATNIAYEVNSPLTGVLGYTGLLLKADDITEDKREKLRTIERETLRAREILKHLLDFSRRRPPSLEKADVSTLVRDIIALVNGQARMSNVNIVSRCSDTLPPIAVDIDEIKQVFVNLISNSIFAMPEGGTLTIRCKQEQDRSRKETVVVELADTGRGIAEEHLDKIFDPFFTSKSESESDGLGLSISYMIVQNHGGRIEVESRLGEGSIFRVILPA